MGKGKIQLEDNLLSMASKMSEGNPGALFVIMEIITHGSEIDPDCGPLGPIAPVLDLDMLEIYGPRIWMLYKDVCGENLRTMCAVLRAWQLGFTTERAIKSAVDNYGEGIDVSALVAQVEDRLPNFQKAAAPAEKSDRG